MVHKRGLDIQGVRMASLGPGCGLEGTLKLAQGILSAIDLHQVVRDRYRILNEGTQVRATQIPYFLKFLNRH
jgi:hypothetical protein